MKTIALLTTLSAATLVAVAPAAVQAAPAAKCFKQKGQVAQSGGARAFVKGKQLYVCAPFNGTKKAGPWSGGKISMYGPSVVWTQRSAAQGLTQDRMWAFGYGRTWLKGVAPVKGSGASDADLTVSSLKARGFLATWVTGAGTVVQATDYQGAEQVFKEGGQSTSQTVDREIRVLGADPGLLTEKPDDATLQTIGRWPALAGTPAFAKSLKLELLDDGDADDCGGARSYGITVEPIAGQPVGWATSWSFTTTPC